MENTISNFIKADENTLINATAVVWIKKMGDCLEVCNKITGCKLGYDTHKICKFNTPDSYNKLNALFE